MLGTTDLIGASNIPRNARPMRNVVYVLVLATPSHMRAFPSGLETKAIQAATILDSEKPRVLA